MGAWSTNRSPYASSKQTIVIPRPGRIKGQKEGGEIISVRFTSGEGILAGTVNGNEKSLHHVVERLWGWSGRPKVAVSIRSSGSSILENGANEERVGQYP